MANSITNSHHRTAAVYYIFRYSRSTFLELHAYCLVQVVLNSDSESVLVKGLRRFACQIRRDHGLLHHEEVDTRPPPPSLSSSDEESSDGDDSGGTDEEDNEGTRTPMELEGDEGGEGGLEKKEEREAGVLGKRLPLEGRSADGGTEKGLLVEMSSRCTAALDTGEAAGLLGEYLRGSPQLHDLFSLWDLDVRKVKTLSLFIFPVYNLLHSSTYNQCLWRGRGKGGGRIYLSLALVV